MNVLVLDFETFWRSKDYTLSKLSPLDYIRSPLFHAQLLGISINNSKPVVYSTNEDIDNVLRYIQWDNYLVVGHNLDGFDGLILSERWGIRPKWTLDTIVAMRWLGLSSVCGESHASLTSMLNTGVKRQGTMISDGKNWPQDFTPVEQEAFKMYCGQDVEQCTKNIYSMMNSFSSREELAAVIKFSSITSRMATDPVFQLDLPKLLTYRQELLNKTAQAREELKHIFHFNTDEEFLKSIRSTAKLTSMFQTLGVEPPLAVSAPKTKEALAKIKERIAILESMDMPGAEIAELRRQIKEREYRVKTPSYSKTNIEFLNMLEHEDPRVALLARARLENFSAGELARCENLIRFAQSAKPLPIMLKTFGAHTSRYGAGTTEGKSSGINVQNFKSRGGKSPLREAVRTPPGYVLVEVDSSQIECRTLAYVANQTDLLQLFRDKGDPYADFANKCAPQYSAKQIHDGAKAGNPELSLLRQVAKTIVLGAGYGVGHKKIAQLLWRSNVKLEPEYTPHENSARNFLNVYRSTNSNIAGFWQTCNDIMAQMLNEAPCTFGGPQNNLFRFGMDSILAYGPCHTITLPSGFKLRYPHFRQERSEETGELEFVYERQRGKNTQTLRMWAGSLTENLIQSLAFQILMWQFTKMMEEGLLIKVNVHDSGGVLAPEAEAQAVADRMVAIMRTPPPWAPGLPLDAEYKIGTNFEVI